MSNSEVSRSSINVLLLSALVALTSLACGRDKGPPALAELVEVVDGNATKRTNGVDDWVPAAVGDLFRPGHELRTDENGGARLRIGGETLRMGPATTIFFATEKIDFYGEIVVDQGLDELGIDFGEAEITTTGKLRIVKTDDQLKFEVLVGNATITQIGGREIVLSLGDELAFSIGDGKLEMIKEEVIDAGVPDAAVDQEPDAAVEASSIASSIQATVTGKGVRIRDADGGKWAKLQPGEHDLPSNSDIDIKRKSKVLLVRGNDRVSIAGASMAYVNAQAAEFVTINKGRADAHAESASVTIGLPGDGTIELHANQEVATNTHIEVGSKGSTVDVKTGKATMRVGDKSDVIGMGESARLHRGKIEVIDRAPAFSHVTLPTMANASLHVVKAPINTRINFKEHCARAVVEVARGRNFARPSQRRAGKGNAILVLKSGSHRYRVRCYEGDTLASKPAFVGRVSVRKDSGSRPLPRGAPENTIDADGRRYTVLFQNRLPAITVQWRKAPKAGQYILNIVPSKGKSRELSGAKPEHSFKPGTFTEDSYEYWFVADGEESKHSKLKISFDNAAATGYLSAPQPNAKIAGSEAQVSGAAVLGWKVSVGGKELTLDRQYRFDEIVQVAADGLAIRFFHPKYGAHYYVRPR